MKKLSHRELLDRQTHRETSRLPILVILNNVRSLYNVGSIFRTADGVGIEKLWLCGITGHPGGSKTGIEKTALGAEKTVPWEYRGDACSVLRELRSRTYQMVLVEQTKESIPYEEYEPRFPVCLVFGNEVAGVSDDLLSLCDQAIEIEMSGLKNSLNVTVAFGIVGYHCRNRFLSSLRATEGSEAI